MKKIKPLYIYISGFVLVIAAILLFENTSSKKATQSMQGNMPNDEIHQGLAKDGMGFSSGDLKEKARMELERLKKEVEANPDDTAKIKSYADMLFAGHKSDEAKKYFLQILDKGPKRIDILFSLSAIEFSRRNWDGAENYTKEILKVDKNNLGASYSLGVIALEKGNKTEAKRIWEDIIKKHPNTEAAGYAQNALQKIK